MADAIVHRGPDDSGVWSDASNGIALGFRRLSILDLSPLGHQPMPSPSSRYTIVFNGEIYNFRELRHELEALGHTFRSGSDTEVILAAADAWGIEKMIPRLNGMFAIGLWDAKEKTLTLARDHLGIKPMYYGWANGVLLFGSELKALRAYPDLLPEVDRGALTLYMRHGYVPGPWSMYRDIFKLQPGHMVTFRSPSDRREPTAYWSLRGVANDGLAHPFSGSETEAIDQLDTLLREVVKHQMISDVPLGAFLSGGIDSSIVVAMMQAQSSRPVKTFSIGFHEAGFNEAPYAKEIADYLRTEHTEMYVTHDDARNLIPRLPEIYDEPFADSSGIPTTLLSILTREHVTVSLSGDGGDEVFAGYNQHWQVEGRWKSVERVPAAYRRPLSKALGLVGESMGDSSFATKCRQRSAFVAAKNPDQYIRARLNHWPTGRQLVRGGFEPSYELLHPERWPQVDTIAARQLYVDSVLGLPDDMLTKVDRASSSASLEVRVPLLDPRVVAFGWSLPWNMKVRSHGVGKWVLRSALARYVPPEMFERPKQGFGVPIARWLRGPLRDWCEHLIDEKRLREEGFFDPAPIRRQWRLLQEDTSDWEMSLWIVLMFQAWQERWLGKAA